MTSAVASRHLTPRQVGIAQFIRDHQARHGCSPTMVEIGAEFSISKATAYQHVYSLAAKGVLTKGPTGARMYTYNPASRVLPDPRTPRQIAEAIVQRLFVNGDRERADRLVLKTNIGRNLGGWAAGPVCDLIEDELKRK